MEREKLTVITIYLVIVKRSVALARAELYRSVGIASAVSCECIGSATKRSESIIVEREGLSIPC